MERVRLADVARQAGVHPATASRALNPETRARVNAKTVRRVQRIAERLGYQPNVTARGLRTSRSYTIGVLIPDLENPLFAPIVRGAERVVREAGYTLVLADTGNDPSVQSQRLTSLTNRGMDGFLIAAAWWEDSEVDALADSGEPVVLINRRTRLCPLPFVGTDDARGIDLCVEHLVELGHRRVAHLAGPDTTSAGRQRLEAFYSSARRHGLAAADLPVGLCDAFTEAAGATTARLLLAEHPEVTAIVAGNDLLALGAMEAIAARGLSCPTDVSVTGFNDLRFMDRIEPSLTTVRLPLEQIGATAATLLMSRIGGENPAPQPTQTILPVTFVKRGSTAPRSR